MRSPFVPAKALGHAHIFFLHSASAPLSPRSGGEGSGVGGSLVDRAIRLQALKRISMRLNRRFFPLVPAKAGTQRLLCARYSMNKSDWIPACAGMSGVRGSIRAENALENAPHPGAIGADPPHHSLRSWGEGSCGTTCLSHHISRLRKCVHARARKRGPRVTKAECAAPSFPLSRERTGIERTPTQRR